MNDRDLLERAAKAAGIEFLADRPTTDCLMVLMPNGDAEPWSPLTDDGEALRLAVKLGIAIQLHPAWVYARAVMPTDHYEWREITEGWAKTNQPYAATRRAIVRAAASVFNEPLDLLDLLRPEPKDEPE